MDAALEVAVLDMRKRHHPWGPKRILHELKKAGFDSPSHMAIYRALLRAGLVVKAKVEVGARLGSGLLNVEMQRRPPHE